MWFSALARAYDAQIFTLNIRGGYADAENELI